MPAKEHRITLSDSETIFPSRRVEIMDYQLQYLIFCYLQSRYYRQQDRKIGQALKFTRSRDETRNLRYIREDKKPRLSFNSMSIRNFFKTVYAATSCRLFQSVNLFAKFVLFFRNNKILLHGPTVHKFYGHYQSRNIFFSPCSFTQKTCKIRNLSRRDFSFKINTWMYATRKT